MRKARDEQHRIGRKRFNHEPLGDKSPSSGAQNNVLLLLSRWGIDIISEPVKGYPLRKKESKSLSTK
ncbi:MAG: hypothetical protein K5657_04460 [Desulfovibrio sp.]|nr:hypothetical protein [Desulfovibrio sp.]